MNKHELLLHKPFTDPEKIEYWDSLYEQKDFYGESFRQRMDTALTWLKEFNVSEHSNILDAGCGAGRLVNEVARMKFNAIGMDYSFGMLIKAESIRYQGDKGYSAFCQGNIESLPYKNSSLDAIISLGVISYLKSETKALREFARALKPGGILIFSFFNKARMVSHLDLPQMLKSIFKKVKMTVFIGSKDGSENNDQPRLTTYLIPKMKKALDSQDFIVLGYTTIPAELFTLFGREVFPREMTVKISRFFEQFSNVPLIDSFGAMCVIKAMKKPSAMSRN